MEVDAPLALQLSWIDDRAQELRQVLMEYALLARFVGDGLMQIAVFREGGQLIDGGDAVAFVERGEIDAHGGGNLNFTDADAGAVIRLQHVRLILEHDDRMADIVAD